LAVTGGHAARDRELAAEQALLDQTRAAMAKRRPQDALRALMLHAKRHPEGRLTEERRALLVVVLVALERFDDAKAAGTTFLRRHPKSVFGPTVKRALERAR